MPPQPALSSTGGAGPGASSPEDIGLQAEIAAIQRRLVARLQPTNDANAAAVSAAPAPVPALAQSFAASGYNGLAVNAAIAEHAAPTTAPVSAPTDASHAVPTHPTLLPSSLVMPPTVMDAASPYPAPPSSSAAAGDLTSPRMGEIEARLAALRAKLQD